MPTPTRGAGLVLTVMLLSGAACSKPVPATSNEAIGSGASPSSSASASSSGPSSGRAEAGRSGAPPVQKLSGPITVIAIGDSLTEGAGDEDERGYPARLQTVLDSTGHPGSTVLKLGKSGWDSEQVITGLEPDRPQLDQATEAVSAAKAGNLPIVATVLIGSNDLWYAYGNQARTTPDEEQENLARYRTNVEKIVSTLRQSGAQVVLGVNDDQSKRPVMTDPKLRRETFPDIEDAEVSQMSAQARRYADVIRQIAKDNGALVADFLDAPFFSNPALLADDGNHPNAKGYDEMTQVWLDAMQPLL
ncbi:MAG: hypothetical protein HYX32_10205 [Actinobacteria bacterium]|nr:hypothetical protein [Actinomycetota bacterium]